MKRLCGLIIFALGLGMAIMLFVPVNFCTVMMILFLLLVGYYLFCCGK